MSKLIEKIEKKLIELGLAKSETIEDETPVEDQNVKAEEVVIEEDAQEIQIGSVVETEIIPAPVKITISAIGAPAYAVDAEGNETALEDGEYVLKGEKKLVVAEGKVTEFADIEVTPETPEGEGEAEVEMETQVKAEDQEEEVKAEDQKDDDQKETQEETEVKAEEETQEEPKVELAESLRTALGKIDITKPGSYYVYIEVDEDLKVTYETMSSNTYETLVMEKHEKEFEAKLEELTKAYDAKLQNQKQKYEDIVAALKSNGTPKTGEPQKSEEVKLSRTEILKQQIAEKRKK